MEAFHQTICISTSPTLNFKKHKI